MTEWAGPAGLHHAAATAIQVPNGDVILVQATRRKGRPAFSPDDILSLDTFRPHLARAGLLATRWRLAQFQAAAVALAQIGLPAAILDGKGQVLATNELIVGLSSCLTWLPRDRLALIDKPADLLLQRAIAVLQDPAAPAVRSIPAKARDTGEVMIVHLIPATGKTREFFGGGFGILVVTRIPSPSPVDIALLHGLFDLTPSEARVANGIAQGLSLDQIADRNCVTHETVRSHAKVIYAKTGTSRQAQLSGLLARLASFPLK
jgi:DNA-binding CsgD family transcriptional regulator